MGIVSEGVFGWLWRNTNTFFVPPFSDRGRRALKELVTRRADEVSDQLGATGVTLATITTDPQTERLIELRGLATEGIKARGNAVEPPSQDPESDARVELAGAMEQRVTDELDLVRTRLLSSEPELYGAVDRMRAEAEFRFAVVPPLLALLAVLVTEQSAWWLWGLLVAGVLWRQARSRLRDAGDMLIDALRVGPVDAPTLERVRAEVERLMHESRSTPTVLQ
jgi:hypothetical protein